MNLILKHFQFDAASVDMKKLDAGELEVVFATMGLWDKDGDWTEPGFFGQQHIVMLPTHDWSHVPLGKGVTREEGNLAIVSAKMNLELKAAQDWLSAIKFDLKHGKPLQQYSYGFKVLDGGAMQGERTGRTGRILKPLEDMQPGCKIWEFSPVLVGAGEGTRTLSAKGHEPQAGKTFAEEVQHVADSVSGLVSRAKSLADLREKDGRELSAPNKERLAALADSLGTSLEELAKLWKQPPGEQEARKELVRMVKARAGIK